MIIVIGIKIIIKLLINDSFTNFKVDSEKIIKKNPIRKTVILYLE